MLMSTMNSTCRPKLHHVSLQVVDSKIMKKQGAETLNQGAERDGEATVVLSLKLGVLPKLKLRIVLFLNYFKT